MKKIFFMVTFIVTIIAQRGFAQQNNNTGQSSSLLLSYYDVKNALVASNTKLAAIKASEFIKILNNNKIDVTQQKALAKDAGQIATSKDLKEQRDYFTSLSTHMITLAKASKLSSDPIYELYCPMKKSSWLSSEKEIKNPYFGSAMLTCGKVTGTIK